MKACRDKVFRTACAKILEYLYFPSIWKSSSTNYMVASLLERKQFSCSLTQGLFQLFVVVAEKECGISSLACTEHYRWPDSRGHKHSLFSCINCRFGWQWSLNVLKGNCSWDLRYSLCFLYLWMGYKPFLTDKHFWLPWLPCFELDSDNVLQWQSL